MDPGTILAVVTETITVTQQLIQYVKQVKDADKDRQRIRDEAQLLLLRLRDLQEDVETSQAGQDQYLLTACLSSLKPALEQFKDAMNDLLKKLLPRGGSNTMEILRRLKWPFDVKEVDAILARIERLKSLLTLTLQRNIR